MLEDKKLMKILTRRWPNVSAECARSVVAAGRDLTGTIGQALWLVLDEVQSLRQEVNSLRDDVSRLHND